MITKERISKVGLVLFCSISAVVMIDHFRWHLDGPRYTHRMWYEDRLARIDEEIKLQVQIDELKNQINKLKSEINNRKF